MSDQIFSYVEFLKQFPSNSRAREYWRLFKVKGGLDNRHLSFNICQLCTSNLFKDKERLKIELDKDSNCCSIISFKLCEDCIERNIFETNSYIYKYSLKKRNVSASNSVSVEQDEPNEESTEPKKKESKKIEE